MYVSECAVLVVKFTRPKETTNSIHTLAAKQIVCVFVSVCLYVQIEMEWILRDIKRKVVEEEKKKQLRTHSRTRTQFHTYIRNNYTFAYASGNTGDVQLNKSEMVGCVRLNW